MQRILAATLVLIFVGAAALARADDKPDPTGTWKWSVTFTRPGQTEQTREMTLKLKLDGDKLSGALLGRDGKENPIQDASFKDGNVSFKVVRERNGNKMTASYNGKLSGDTIKGKTEFGPLGKTQTRDWEAKRVKS
jgi:hypothetical protein